MPLLRPLTWSTARLSLAFKELTRMSPLEYLTLLRVERSKTLLRDTALSIKEIAAEDWLLRRLQFHPPLQANYRRYAFAIPP